MSKTHSRTAENGLDRERIARAYGQGPDVSIAGQSTNAVNGLDLYAFLGVGKVFAVWIQERIETYGLLEHLNFEVFSESGNNPHGGRPVKDYEVSLDMAKELAMGERSE